MVLAKKSNSKQLNNTFKSKEARHSTLLGNYKPVGIGGVQSGLTFCLDTLTKLGMG